MKHVLVCLGCFAFAGSALCSALYGQSPKAPAGFEVADVHSSPMLRNPFLRGPFFRPGHYEIRQATMVDLISIAYDVEREKVVGGPNWLEMERFEVIAQAPMGAKKPEMRPLLQGLLAERFHLAVHKVTQPMPAFALTVGKKPQLKKSDGSGQTGCQEKVSMPPPTPGGGPIMPMLQYSCRNETMAMFVKEVRAQTTAPVVDQTGLEGAWDFDLTTSMRGFIILGGAGPGGDSTTIFGALEKQLGLKLTAATLPMDVMAVDSADRKPSANVPGAIDILKKSAPPTEFEVADIKPSAPGGGRGMRFQIQPGGRVNMSGMTLRTMIMQAWNLTPDMLVGAPKWIDDDRYDLVAKAPRAQSEEDAPDAGAGPGRGPDLDMDSVWVMMRALLADRFKLVVHEEEQMMPAYTLLAGKPKMKKADPASRSRFAEGPGTDGKDPRNTNPSNGRLITAQNVTMAEFAERLQSLAGGYVHSPVLDATGLDGAYDFTLNFSPAGLGVALAGRGGRGGGDAGPASNEPAGASDPTGAISLPEAVEKQLGLKLELQKRPVKVLVIDKLERTPTEN